MIARFIDEQRTAGRGVESVCAVLRQQGVQVAPRTYRSWRRNLIPARWSVTPRSSTGSGACGPVMNYVDWYNKKTA
jgi:hypothetical protein